MKPAFSVILLTTLIGVGQGLFLAVYTRNTSTRQRLRKRFKRKGFERLVLAS